MTARGIIYTAVAIGVFLILLLFNKYITLKQLDKKWTMYSKGIPLKSIPWLLLYGGTWVLYGFCIEIMVYAVTIFI